MAKPLISDQPRGTPRLQPQANVFDTFIRPPSAGESGLGQLASALSNIAPELRGIGNAVSERDAETEAKRGEAFAADMENSKATWAKLKEEGKISASQNPHFIIAAKRKFGQVAAGQFRQVMQDSLAKLGDAPTPEQFEQAVADARKTFLESNAGKAGNDLVFMQGFNAVAEQDIDNARRAFAAQHAKQFEEDASRAFVMAGNKMIRETLELRDVAGQFLPNGAKVDSKLVLDRIAEKLNAETDAWTGVNPDVKRNGQLSNNSIEKLTAEMVASFMKDTGNADLAKRLARKVKVGDGVLADTETWRNTEHALEQSVVAERRQQEADELMAQQQAAKDATASVTDTMLGQWRAGKVDRDSAIATLRAAGVKDAENTVTEILYRLPELDPQYYVGYRSRVAQGNYPSQAELDNAVRTNRISRPQYDGLLNDIAQAQNAERMLAAQSGATTEAIWSRPEMKIIEDGIRAAAKDKATVNNFGFVTGYAGFTETDVQAAIAEAKIDLAQTLAANWSKYGSGASSANLASKAWRSYAFKHKIITYEQSLEGKPVLPADKGKANALMRGRAQTDSVSALPVAPPASSAAPPSYTRSEIQQMRADFAKWPTMSLDERRAWASDPRHKAVLTELGVTGPNDIAQKLAEAYNTARP